MDIAAQQVDINDNPTGVYNTVVNAGSSYSGYWLDYQYVYPKFAEPKFQTIEYDFWQNPDPSQLPGGANFSTSQTNFPLITGVGSPNFQVVGYAKLQVTNSVDSGVYGFLGQYFANAYATDSNGNVSSNTGILSSYGNFFATAPGQAALVTMPDPDTGEQGTAVVYCVSLNLDKNHDGIMDTSFNGPDTTSASSPYVFWCNNNFDRWKTTISPLYVETEQGDQQTGGCPYAPNTPTPDCNYLNQFGERIIPCTRDLEDYARLWLAGVTTNLLAQLPIGASVTLSMNAISGMPTIDLFAAADPDGGIGYQTNETVAMEQTNEVLCPYTGRVGPGQSVQLNSLMNTVPTHFIWCGVSNGIGQLTLTISNGTNVFGQTSAYIQIVDIKQLYER